MLPAKNRIKSRNETRIQNAIVLALLFCSVVYVFHTDYQVNEALEMIGTR